MQLFSNQSGEDQFHIHRTKTNENYEYNIQISVQSCLKCVYLTIYTDLLLLKQMLR